MTDDVQRSNIAALGEAIRRLEERWTLQQLQINNLSTTLRTILERLDQIERLVKEQKVRMTGHGPSVREPKDGG